MATFPIMFTVHHTLNMKQNIRNVSRWIVTVRDLYVILQFYICHNLMSLEWLYVTYDQYRIPISFTGNVVLCDILYILEVLCQCVYLD